MGRITNKHILEKLNSFEGKFQAIDTRFDSIDSKFTAIDDKFTSIDSKFTSFHSKFAAFDSKFADFDSKFKAADSKFDLLEKNLSKKIETEIEGLAIIFKNGFDHAEQQLTEFKKEMYEFRDRMETDMEDVKLRLDQHAYAFEVKDLNKRVTRIERKIGLE